MPIEIEPGTVHADIVEAGVEHAPAALQASALGPQP
jgi:hypothetical protein